MLHASAKTSNLPHIYIHTRLVHLPLAVASDVNPQFYYLRHWRTRIRDGISSTLNCPVRNQGVWPPLARQVITTARGYHYYALNSTTIHMKGIKLLLCGTSYNLAEK
jgi:hypothetical protein